MFVCVCVCVCVYPMVREKFENGFKKCMNFKIL